MSRAQLASEQQPHIVFFVTNFELRRSLHYIIIDGILIQKPILKYFYTESNP